MIHPLIDMKEKYDKADKEQHGAMIQHEVILNT